MRAVSIDKIDLTTKKTSIGTEDSLQSIDRSRIDPWAKKFVLQWLSKLDQGYLIVEDGLDRYTFGDASSPLRASVIIYSPVVYRDIMFNGLVGAGEAYMRGAWKSVDLVAVIRVLSANLTTMQSLGSVWSVLNQQVAALAHRFWRSNSQRNSRLNIAAHYDLGNDFFRLFLDPTMMYSSAIFPNDSISLTEASLYKLDHICKRLQLKPSDHLLEIGTGWGGMAIYAAKHYGCRVTTTTLSKEQFIYATEQVKAAGLEDRVTLLLDDYRDLEKRILPDDAKGNVDNRFDKLVSIEMIEAVGHQYYQQYFSACSRLLKPNGLLLIQAITVPDQRYLKTQKTTDFIQQYIFPGGELPCIDIMSSHITKDTDMQIVGLEDITLDYAKTLAAWRRSFFEKIEDVKAQGFDDTFIRMWDFYLAYCEGGFRERTISTIQLLAAKPRCQTLPIVAE